MGERQLTEEEASYRRGYLVVWVALIFVLATVNIWGAVSVMVMAYVGAGAWFYTGAVGGTPEMARGTRSNDRTAVARRRAAAAAAGVTTVHGGAAQGETGGGERPSLQRSQRSHTKQDRPTER
jgi:hypothetical protein